MGGYLRLVASLLIAPVGGQKLRQSKSTRRLTLTLLAVATVSLVFGVGPASAWKKDPDLAVDAARAVASGVLPPAPDTTIGDGDVTSAGIADVAVGSGDLTTYLADPPASGGTYWVDNTPLSGDCPQATYPSIQAAVNASGPKDTVKVCPGTYSEQVQIVGHNHDGLRLESLKPLGATIQWPTPETSHQLIYINNADGVTIRGFTISGPFPSGGCASGPPPADRHEGVLFDNAFNGRLDHNHITLIRDVNPALWGCQQGDAVAIGRRIDVPLFLGSPASAQIDHNLIDRYQKNGVQAVNPGTYLEVRQNTINASTEAALQVIIASNGVVVFRQAAAIVEQNIVSNNKYTPFPLSTGIVLDESPAGSSKVDHNRVFNNDYGIETDTQSGLEISHNDVFQNISDAITICGDPGFGCGLATDIVVRANDIQNNGGSGIALFDADSNLLKANHIQQNGTPSGDTTDGVRVDSSSTNNQILENHMQSNLTHDCHDDSAGTGTGGTANSWINDIGVTENRPDLCKNASVTP